MGEKFLTVLALFLYMKQNLTFCFWNGPFLMLEVT